MQEADEAAFRATLQEYLVAHRPDTSGKSPDERLRAERDWAARLYDDGFAAPAWPREWGGMGLPLQLQLIYHEEMTRARVRPHPSPGAFICGPTLIQHGTDAQRHRFLRPMLRADELWCQGFSEPGAGSDLPALRTSAQREGDRYIVNGQKIWTSGAHTADWMYALVRTGPPGSRQNGISYLLIDMHSPGIEVRRIRDMSGGAHFCEVFFTDVSVPIANRVGEEDAGWSIARTSLGHERSTAFISNGVRYRRTVDELLVLARQLGRLDDPEMRNELAKLEVAVRLLSLNGFRALDNVLETGEPGPAASVNRMFYGAFERHLHEVAVSLLGAYGLLSPKDSRSPDRGRWTWGFLKTRASTIGAGTLEIQKNTVAQQVLGLPRGPGVAVAGKAEPQ